MKRSKKDGQILFGSPVFTGRKRLMLIAMGLCCLPSGSLFASGSENPFDKSEDWVNSGNSKKR